MYIACTIHTTAQQTTPLHLAVIVSRNTLTHSTHSKVLRNGTRDAGGLDYAFWLD